MNVGSGTTGAGVKPGTRFQSGHACAESHFCGMAFARSSCPAHFQYAVASQHHGYVRSGKKAIPGATVTASLDQWKLVTTTDESGMYTFDLPGSGKWVFQTEMFGFSPAREERTVIGGASVLDFDLELQAGGVAVTPATAPAAGFRTVDVEAQADSRAQIEQQMEAAA